MSVANERGLVVPDGIPGAETKVSVIRGQAESLAAAATALVAVSGDILTDWELPLTACFEGPMAFVAWGAMRAPSQDLAGLSDDLTAAAKAMETYADEVDAVLRALRELRTEARALVALVGEDGMVWAAPHDTTSWSVNAYATGKLLYPGDQPDEYLTQIDYLRRQGATIQVADGWQVQVRVPWEDLPSLREQNDLLVTRIGFEVGRWHEAEATCANTLVGLLRGVCVPEDAVAAAPRQAFMSPGVQYDWGKLPPAPEASHGIGGFFEALINEGVVGTFAGLTALLFGHDAQRQRWFDSQSYAAAWGGLHDQAQAVGTVGTLVAFSPQRFAGGDYDQHEVAAATLLWSGYEHALAWDTWSENPGYASGQMTPGLLALLGGSLGMARTGLVRGQVVIDLELQDIAPAPFYGRWRDSDGTPFSTTEKWAEVFTTTVRDPDGTVRQVRSWDEHHPHGFVAGKSERISVADLEAANGNRYVDRAGQPGGATFGGLPDGRPATAPERAAGPELARAEYHRYEFSPHADDLLDAAGLEVRVGTVAENLGGPGGGQQVMIGNLRGNDSFIWMSARELVRSGILREVAPSAY